MKITKVKEEFKQFGVQELQEKLDNLRRDLFGLKLNSSTSHVKDYSQFKKLRKNIAQASTYLEQAEKRADALKA
ncbi:MAG: 50S ribosomal protein L29 [Candidatus Babeliales bacterium]|nr:50S ribosomal protein L29 [Candidatus Babeliales bacterium]